MSILSLMKESPNSWYYHSKDKLWQYVYTRSEMAWEKGRQLRNTLNTVSEHKRYRAQIRDLFIQNMGGIPYDKTYPLNAKTVGTITEENLNIEKVIFEARKGVYITTNLYVPHRRAPKCGAVLFVVGHARLGKASPQYQKIARTIASSGLIVMVMDPVGQGERCSYWEPGMAQPMVEPTVHDHIYAGNQCFLTGNSLIKYFVADAMRAIDYLEMRPEIDKDKIGITGSSGGGTLTSHMMICDDRIKAAAPATYITDRKAFMLTHKTQDAEQIWLNAGKFGFDYYDILICFAPKPCILLTVESDFFPIEGAERVFEETKRFWELYGLDNNYQMIMDKSLHKYTDYLGEKVAEFFAKALENRDITAKCVCKTLDEMQLKCTQTGQVCFDFADAVFVYEENLCEYRNHPIKTAQTIREFLNDKIHFQRDTVKNHLRVFEPVYENGLKMTQLMWFSQHDLPNSGFLFQKHNADMIEHMIVILSDNGTDDLERFIYKIRKEACANTAVLLVNLSGIGPLSPYDGNEYWFLKEDYGIIDAICKNMYFFGDSLCALNLYEMEKLIEIIKENYCSDIRFVSSGRSAMLCELFNQYQSIDFEIEGETESLSYILQNKYYENYNIARIIIPGILNYK